MNSFADPHHRKTLVFFIVLVSIFIFLLVLLFRVPATGSSLQSDVLEKSLPTISKEVTISQEVPIADSARRIRLTKLLLRYQSQLQKIESDVTASQDPKNQNLILNLRKKIERLQKIITSLSTSGG